jgi:hypothetical protein
VTAGEINEVPDYIGLLSEMCDDFDLFQRSKKFALNPRVPAHLTLIYGLNCHAHYMVRRCLPLLAESTIVAVTIVRSVFECGVMAQWLRWFPGSEDGLLEESHRQMAALTKISAGLRDPTIKRALPGFPLVNYLPVAPRARA